MIEKNEIEKFLDLYVAVGVDHEFIPNKLFFYYGYIENLTEKEIKLKLKKGIKIIRLDQIKDIHKTENNIYNEYYGGN